MPRTGPKVGFKDELDKRHRRMVYDEHCHELRRRGIDPDWIGSHEVTPVCCSGCGKAIPWAVLKNWRD